MLIVRVSAETGPVRTVLVLVRDDGTVSYDVHGQGEWSTYPGKACEDVPSEAMPLAHLISTAWMEGRLTGKVVADSEVYSSYPDAQQYCDLLDAIKTAGPDVSGGEPWQATERWLATDTGTWEPQDWWERGVPDPDAAQELYDVGINPVIANERFGDKTVAEGYRDGEITKADLEHVRSILR